MRNIVDVEKTIEFILSHQANAEVQMEKFREGMVELRAALTAQAAAQAAAHAAQAEALKAQAEAQAEALTAQAEALKAQAEVHAKEYARRQFLGAKTDARLDRAIRLSVRDARAQ